MKTAVICNGLEIRLEGELGGFTSVLTCEKGAAQGLFNVQLRVCSVVPAVLPRLVLAWDLPSVDFHYKWNTRCFQNRALDTSPGSENYIKSNANSGIPAYCLFNLDGINTCTWAISDATHDTTTGGSYEDGKTYACKAEIHGEKVGVVSEYSVTLRFDFRRIPYYTALSEVAQWWGQMAEYRPCSIPEAARMPLLSTWYSYKLNVEPDDLERQCGLAKALGMDAVILDDGWQTQQQEFGYQNNGDWEVSAAKFPDFGAHVKRVQAMGMKYMVWFSVPFVGVESKAYERFKDKLLPARPGARHFCLDPRFKETRAHLADTYAKFLVRYGIDGFKMDFISTFEFPPNLYDMEDSRRDCVSLGVAVCRLLDDVMARLRAINPEILVEFRQAYTGPAMRKYGNMFRAVDCPNSIGDNRVRTLDTRLLCGSTVVHADPITWHDDEPVHSAAMQIIHTLFSVPQISRKVTELTEPHKRMLRQQLAFCREHRDVLLAGELRPLYPQHLYPLVVARNKSKLLAAFYADLLFKIDEDIPEQLILVNGSYRPELLIDLVQPMGRSKVVVTSCTGEVLAEKEMNLTAGLHRIEVPAAAHARVCRVD